MTAAEPTGLFALGMRVTRLDESGQPTGRSYLTTEALREALMGNGIANAARRLEGAILADTFHYGDGSGPGPDLVAESWEATQRAGEILAEQLTRFRHARRDPAVLRLVNSLRDQPGTEVEFDDHRPDWAVMGPRNTRWCPAGCCSYCEQLAAIYEDRS